MFANDRKGSILRQDQRGLFCHVVAMLLVELSLVWDVSPSKLHQLHKVCAGPSCQKAWRQCHRHSQGSQTHARQIGY